MKVIIFGASGNVGYRLTREMLARGHTVTAFIYGPSPFKALDRLHVIQGDVHDAKAIEKAVKGQDVVLSSLGSWGTPTKDILSSAMTNIIPAMKKFKIRRIVSLTGADARDLGDKPNLLQKVTHVVFAVIAKPIMKDGEDHIRQLRESGLDWTVVRSPVMTNRGKHGNFRLSVRLPMPWHTIHRKDVVMAMTGLAESRDYVKQSPVISRN